VDGTDFKIVQLAPFSKKWYSHKFNGPGLRYEVGLCIQTGDIVWIHGPFPPGDWPDLSIFRHALLHHLGDGERVEADAGYIGEFPRHVKTPVHETVNKRFKQWGCLKQVFRHVHDLAYKHASVFRAVAVITQLAIEDGEPLYAVEYHDDW
jgi:hypothetical protein